MARHAKTAFFYDIKERKCEKSGNVRYIVRWRVNDRPGNHPSRSFLDRTDAEVFRDDLADAAVDRERFDLVTGLPVSMVEEDDVLSQNEVNVGQRLAS